jgi:delta-1-pyrroline-5-carboxylate synthetase
MDSRNCFRRAETIVIKVGTAVVTRADGRLALARLGALVETIRSITSQNKRVVLVSSGSIGLGANYLGLERPVPTEDCPAAAAAGQSLLMEKYRQLFGNLDMRCAQVLLTEEDFANKDRQSNLASTLQRLLDLQTVPIVNENDAITSAIKMEHKQGVFYDNDRLAGLTATALKADALILLSNIDALYTGPPDEANSQRIASYDPQTTVRFGKSSSLGRGGMESKLIAAQRTAQSGIPVAIASGLDTDALQAVLNGEDTGTFFAPLTTDNNDSSSDLQT